MSDSSFNLDSLSASGITYYSQLKDVLSKIETARSRVNNLEYDLIMMIMFPKGSSTYNKVQEELKNLSIPNLSALIDAIENARSDKKDLQGDKYFIEQLMFALNRYLIQNKKDEYLS